MRLARPAWGVLVDMTENAKAEFGIFVQNLALGHIVGKRARDEYLVFERIAQQLADFLAPRRAGILIQDTVTVSKKARSPNSRRRRARDSRPALQVAPLAIGPLETLCWNSLT